VTSRHQPGARRSPPPGPGVAWIAFLARKITDPARTGPTPSTSTSTGAVPVRSRAVFSLVLGPAAVPDLRLPGFGGRRSRSVAARGAPEGPRSPRSDIRGHRLQLFLLWFLPCTSGLRNERAANVLLPLRVFPHKDRQTWGWATQNHPVADPARVLLSPSRSTCREVNGYKRDPDRPAAHPGQRSGNPGRVAAGDGQVRPAASAAVG